MKKTFHRITLLFFIISPLLLSQSAVTLNQADATDVKNVILIIGDGTGLAHVATTNYLKYKNKRIAFFDMPVTGLVLTHTIDDLITDSAAGATAMATGYKTKNKMINTTPDGSEKTTITESVKQKGMSTGVVVTSHITDATPACFTSHNIHRDHHQAIAEQIINSKVNVLMGGGMEYFIPANLEGSERTDNKNLIDSAIACGYNFVRDRESMMKSNSDNLLGIFSFGGLKGNESEPTLEEMTKKALSILEKNENGFFLMVEGSQIDWEAHSNNLEGVMNNVIELEKALISCLDFAKIDGKTLVIVTADHETGGLTLTGGDKEKGELLKPSWSSKGHTATPVPIYAYGPGSLLFTGVMDNTDVAKKISALLKVKLSPVVIDMAD